MTSVNFSKITNNIWIVPNLTLVVSLLYVNNAQYTYQVYTCNHLLQCLNLSKGQGAPSAATNADGRANKTVINLNKDAAPNRARKTIVNALK